MRSTATGFAPATGAGTSVFTCAAASTGPSTTHNIAIRSERIRIEGTSRRYRSVNTTTDRAGTAIARVRPSSVAPSKAVGHGGCAVVTRRMPAGGAVRTLPAMDVGVSRASFSDSFTVRPGLVLTSERRTTGWSAAPDVDALTSRMLSSPAMASAAWGSNATTVPASWTLNISNVSGARRQEAAGGGDARTRFMILRSRVACLSRPLSAKQAGREVLEAAAPRQPLVCRPRRLEIDGVDAG